MGYFRTKQSILEQIKAGLLSWEFPSRPKHSIKDQCRTALLATGSSREPPVAHRIFEQSKAFDSKSNPNRSHGHGWLARTTCPTGYFRAQQTISKEMNAEPPCWRRVVRAKHPSRIVFSSKAKCLIPYQRRILPWGRAVRANQPSHVICSSKQSIPYQIKAESYS